MKQMLNTLNISNVQIIYIIHNYIHYSTLYMVLSLHLNTLQGDFF